MTLSSLLESSPYCDLPDEFYDLTSPSPLHSPFLISYNHLLGEELGVACDEESVKVANGEVWGKQHPYAMCYAGHQFGYFVPRLGDGRAVNIGSIKGSHLQIKGGGQTLYSRQGDGRAVLRSTIREYLASEMMHGLNIPTTRALMMIGSKSDVMREWEVEKGATLIRVSPSWVRFGTFEYFGHKQEVSKLKKLADYVIKESYPWVGENGNPYALLFECVVERTAVLIAQWMSVGFCHGVMNTDNMSIAGVTLDYGPFSMLDQFEWGYICNHTDQGGRYAYNQQPRVAFWNLQQLVSPFSLIASREELERSLGRYYDIYNKTYSTLMRQKIGFKDQQEGDNHLIGILLGLLERSCVDYTLFFYRLSSYKVGGENREIFSLFEDEEKIKKWCERYEQRLSEQNESDTERANRLKTINPKYVLKNYMLQEAIEKAHYGDFSMIDTLLKIAHDPFGEHPLYERYALATPKNLTNMVLSCSS